MSVSRTLQAPKRLISMLLISSVFFLIPLQAAADNSSESANAFRNTTFR